MSKLESWKSIFSVSGIDYTTQKNIIEAYFKANNDIDKKLIISDNNGQISFTFASVFNHSKNENLNSLSSVNEWTNLLDKCRIYYSKQSFKTRRRSIYWLEIPVWDILKETVIPLKINYSMINGLVFNVSWK